MLSVFFCLTIGLLIPLFGRPINPPPLPHIGVQLYGGYNNMTYPNNSIIPAEYFHRDDRNNDGLNDGLWCQSARNDSNIGVWYYPNGSQVSTVDDSSPLHSVYMSGQIGLYRDYGINNYEGIYTCVIPDEHDVNQTLMVLLCKEHTYSINRGPRIIETTFNSLLSTRDNPAFLISFNVTDGTATYINCTLNDTLIYPNITQTILSYQLPTKILVKLLFQSRVEGWYNCSVSNSRVKDEYYNNISQAYPARSNIYVKEIRPSSVNTVELSSSFVLSSSANKITTLPVNEITTLSVSEVTTLPVSEITTLSVSEVTTLSVSEITTLSVSEVTTLSVSEVITLSVNEVTIIVKPTASSQSSNYICDQVSLLLSIGVGFLLFTNLITITLFIISCLWFIRSKRRHEKLFINCINPSITDFEIELNECSAYQLETSYMIAHDQLTTRYAKVEDPPYHQLSTSPSSSSQSPRSLLSQEDEASATIYENLI